MITFIALVLAFYLWHTFGVAIGLHRLISHHSFKCPKWVEYQFVLSAYLAFHGSPIWWATIHRAHHRHVDTPLDPHSPKFGVMHAYTFYRGFHYPEHIDPSKQSLDLLRDPLYRLLECNGNWRVGYALNVVLCIAFRVALFYLFGWQVALASLIGGIMSLNVPLILNIICHIPRLGVRNFDTPDTSVNVWWMSVICVGEGWHNNHHAHPGAARAGIGKDEFDISWVLLQALSKIGLVSELNEPRLEPAPAAVPSRPLVGAGRD